MNPSPVSKTRRITGNILMFLSGLMLLGSAGAKFAHVPQVVEQSAALGFMGSRLTFIAILEVTSALLFLIPLTRSIGLLLVSSYLGGAIATHMQHGQPFFGPAGRRGQGNSNDGGQAKHNERSTQSHRLGSH